MTAATIGVSTHTKLSLAAAKPAEMPWDLFMASLLESSDPGRLASIVDLKRTESEQDAAESAKQRYMKYRKDPDALLSGTELRRRIHIRRLLESLSLFRGSLQLASADPKKGDTKAMRELLEELDHRIHEARELMKA